jgi:hypothetical protein
MLDDVPSPVPRKGEGKTGKTDKTSGKGNGKDGKTGNSKNVRCAIKGCTRNLSNKRNAACYQELHSADQKSGKPQSEYKVPICGACVTLDIKNGKIVALHSGGQMDFGPMKAVFGPDGNRHNKNMTENVRMAYVDMFADAPETVNIAARAADAGDDEDDDISLSSKAFADPRSQSFVLAQVDTPAQMYAMADSEANNLILFYIVDLCHVLNRQFSEEHNLPT